MSIATSARLGETNLSFFVVPVCRGGYLNHPSYLTSRPSRDLIIAGHQQITRDWWEKQGTTFQFYISQLVIDEASAGDLVAARELLRVLQDLPLLDITAEGGTGIRHPGLR